VSCVHTLFGATDLATKYVVLVHGSDPLTNGGTSFGHLTDGGRCEVLIVNVWLNLGDDLCVSVLVCVGGWQVYVLMCVYACMCVCGCVFVCMSGWQVHVLVCVGVCASVQVHVGRRLCVRGECISAVSSIQYDCHTYNATEHVQYYH